MLANRMNYAGRISLALHYPLIRFAAIDAMVGSNAGPTDRKQLK